MVEIYFFGVLCLLAIALGIIAGKIISELRNPIDEHGIKSGKLNQKL